MDLFDLMTKGADPEDLALDRLEGIVALYVSEDEAVQDEALARAITLCGRQWGGYKAGLEALAARREAAGDDDAAMVALRLREEAEDPGAVIRAARARRAEAGRHGAERAAIIARYGSFDAAIDLTPIEELFVLAAEHLSDPDENGSIDPWSSLAGWSLVWHEVPQPLAEAVAAACPLPATVGDARAEALTWDERRRERAILTDGPGEAMLPTACAARAVAVERLWARELPVRDASELDSRLDYWARRGGDDGTGYAVVLGDLRALVAAGGLGRPAGEGTGERARRLKAENPGWSLARIGQELGISRQAVHKHLKRKT